MRKLLSGEVRVLTPEESISLRGRKSSGVILDGVLIPRLRRPNKFRFKGDEHEFSEGNVQSAVQAIEDIAFDGLVRTNEKIFDLLILGKKSLSQSVDGDAKNFPLSYIDWNPETF
jgi:type I restriction enzyme, R subunit